MRYMIVDNAVSWIDTPYHHLARVKGVGVDCAQLPIAIALEMKLITEELVESIPTYSPQWHLHNREELLLNYLENAGCTETNLPAYGDIIAFKFGRVCSHLGILVNDTQFIHACIRSGKVVVNSFNDDWKTRWVKSYRFPGVNNV